MITRFPIVTCISCTITYLITFIAVSHSEEINIITLPVEEEEADPGIESVNWYDK
jgi:hypothetical protein